MKVPSIICTWTTDKKQLWVAYKDNPQFPVGIVTEGTNGDPQIKFIGLTEFTFSFNDLAIIMDNWNNARLCFVNGCHNLATTKRIIHSNPHHVCEIHADMVDITRQSL